MVAYMDEVPMTPDRAPGPESPRGSQGSADAPGADELTVTRRIELPADAATVWHVVADEHERSHWLDDPDAVERSLRVDESHPEQRLVWTWWSPGDERGASTVDVRLTPTEAGTQVTVIESWPAAAPPAVAAPVRAHAGAPRPGNRRADLWASRLLGLELLLVLAGVAAR
jgi:hypothetical protein